MSQAQCSTGNLQQKLISALQFGLQILRDPATTFRNMSRHGGFIDPLLFMLAAGFIAGLLKVFVTFYYMANGASVTLFTALSSLVIVPISVVSFGYISAFLLSIVMKYLGCDSRLEISFRVCAYLSAISPLAVIALAIPYFGNILILGIFAFLLVTAAVEVYQLNSSTATMVFGISFAVLAVIATTAEYRSRTQHPTANNTVAIQTPADHQRH